MSENPNEKSDNQADEKKSGDEELIQRVVDALKTCYDPEIPVDIYELGLIYAIEIEDAEAGAGEVDQNSAPAEGDGTPSADADTAPEKKPDGPVVRVQMTLTSPMCPVAGTLPPEVEQKVRTVEGVGDARVALVWEPTWTPEKMSEAAKLQLNMF